MSEKGIFHLSRNNYTSIERKETFTIENLWIKERIDDRA